MKISIITPCRNAVERLRRTMQSVQRQSVLSSGGVELEYLIIDGASSDGTRDLCKNQEGIQFLSEPDGGLYDAVAKGLQRSTGDIITYLNAGDILYQEALSLVVRLMRNKDIQWLTGSSCKINEAGEVIDFWKPPRFRREYILNGTYLKGHPHPNIQQEGTFFQRKLLNRMDWRAFRACRLAGDYFLWIHLAAQTELHSARTILGAFQVHAGQLSEDAEGYLREAQGLVRAETFRERVTRYWEFQCPSALKGLLWPHTLGQSKAQVFKYDEAGSRWITR